MQVIGESTKTLPEGYTVSVTKCEQLRADKSMSRFTKLRAWRENKLVEMRVDNVSASSLDVALDLWIREITRQRAVLTKAPDFPFAHPESASQFVHNMAHAGMFIFEALNGDATTKPKSKSTKSRKRKTDAR